LSKHKDSFQDTGDIFLFVVSRYDDNLFQLPELKCKNTIFRGLCLSVTPFLTLSC
jgi:hypothetical protein